MNLEDLRKKSVEDLRATAAETRAEIRATRFGIALRQEGNIRKLRSLKRDLARTLTVIREKDAAAAKSA